SSLGLLCGSAYMSTRHVKSPAPFSFFVSSCPLSLVRPRRRLSPAPTAYRRRPARADAVKAGASSAATTPRGPAFTAIEHDGRLDGSGVDYTRVIYLS